MKIISKTNQKKHEMKDYFREYNITIRLLKEPDLEHAVFWFSESQRSLGSIIERLIKGDIKFKEFLKIKDKLSELNDKLIKEFKECLK